MRDLSGRVAVVLGASAEAGTGYGVAKALAAAGARVVVGARSKKPLEKLAHKIDGRAVVCDAGVESQVKALAETAVNEFGRLDIAVNAAGLPMLTAIAESEEEELHQALQVNYLGNVFFVKHMAAAMGHDGGSIVVISSMSTTHPFLPHFAYACAKSAADCLVRYAAVEYGSRNIRVNSLLPGPIVSDITRDLFSEPGMLETFTKEIPLGRAAYPSDFSDAVLWLAGAAFVTGQNINISGGNNLRRFPTLAERGKDKEGTWVKGAHKMLHDRDSEAQ